ncbi:MAG: glycosyltransferase family 39 protein [Alphaproteobacteria bacterium]|nr:glycosyltransferase family 39 protein [Alphaproteobacteria bacterium]
MMLSRRDLWLLGAITLLAAALRLVKLDASLWYDEVLTLVEFVRLPFGEIASTYTSLNNHVFYSLLAKASVSVFGESAFALRLPAVLFGVAAIPAVFVLARQIGLGALQSHLVAALLALSYHHIWFSQNARGYTGVFFLSIVASSLFLAGTRRPSPGLWIAFAVCIGLALYTHLTAGLYFAALGLVYVVWFGRRLLAPDAPLAAVQARPGLASWWPFAGFAGGGLLALLLHAPLLGDMVTVFTAVSEDGAEVVAEWRNPLWTLFEILGSLPGPALLAYVALPPILLVLALGTRETFRRDGVMGWTFVTHIALTLGVLIALSFRIWPRYFIVDLAFAMIFLVLGTFALADLLSRFLRAVLPPAITGDRLALLGCAGGLGLSLLLALANYTHPKQDFEGALALVRAEAAPGDVATSFGLAGLPLSRYFEPDWPVLSSAGDLEALLARGQRVFVIYAFPDHTERGNPEIMAILEARFEEIGWLPGTMGGGEVIVLASRPPAESPAP